MDTYTIKEVAEMFNLNPSTLRYYEEMGILTNVARTEAKQRLYTQAHINRLKSICCFKRTGMSITKLQAFFACEDQEEEHMDDMLKLLIEQKEQVESQMEQLRLDLEHVKRKIHYYSDIKAAAAAKTQRPEWSDYRDRSFED